jgi:hypothetical protein
MSESHETPSLGVDRSGETIDQAQRLTAIEARVRPMICPTSRSAAAPSWDVSLKTILNT